MTYRCPVCGFEEMPNPPEDHNICSCCGTEFGYHDLARSHRELGLEWLAKGAPWFSTRLQPPPDWRPWKQFYLTMTVAAPAQAIGFEGEPYIAGQRISLDLVRGRRSPKKKRRVSIGKWFAARSRRELNAVA